MKCDTYFVSDSQLCRTCGAVFDAHDWSPEACPWRRSRFAIARRALVILLCAFAVALLSLLRGAI